MSFKPLRIRKAAVLGAGVMGAQIAAHLTNADVETILFDLPAKDGPKSAIALKAIESLKKLSPAPLADKSRAAAIIPANYDEHLELLKDCDLIIEAIAERMDWKRDLYTKIALPVHPLGDRLDDQIAVLQQLQVLVVVGRDDRRRAALVGQRRGRELLEALDRLQCDGALGTVFGRQVEQDRFDVGIGQVGGDLRAH